MALREQFEAQGNWLFRRRSFLPLLILPALFIALMQASTSRGFVGQQFASAYEILCVIISFAGLLIRAVTVGCVPHGTSGRNTAGQEAQTLNTTGMYSIVRHPLYVGNCTAFLGIALFLQVWWFALIALPAYLLYYERIMFAEEEYLRQRFGAAFTAWAAATPAFLPNVRRWRRAQLVFSCRNVLRREYSGVLALAATFTVLKVAAEWFREGTFGIDLQWTVFFASALLTYAILRTLKKHTHVLDVHGR